MVTRWKFGANELREILGTVNTVTCTGASVSNINHHWILRPMMKLVSSIACRLVALVKIVFSSGVYSG
ncbi:unnamed protein product [Victoria cruziana]